MNSQGYTIQLFMADGKPDGLIIATQFGWTGQITVARQTTFDSLLRRADLERPGVYILHGPDPDAPTRSRAYIGEADSITERNKPSANTQGEWWELAVAITATDNALNKGHVRYLEARLIEITRDAGRAVLANTQQPPADRRYLPEAERANMERFIDTIRAVLPVVGLDLLKAAAQPLLQVAVTGTAVDQRPTFTLAHNRSGIEATAIENDGELIVLAGSQALKGMNFAESNYNALRQSLISDGVLQDSDDPQFLVFTRDYPFSSPSAAGSVILDRNTNGRTRWRVTGTNETYGEWQARTAAQPAQSEDTP